MFNIKSKFGISFSNNTFWWFIGKKGDNDNWYKCWYFKIPFLTKEWYRTSILLKEGMWEHDYKDNRKNIYTDIWKDKRKSWYCDYTNKYNNEIKLSSIYLEEIEHRPKWLKWTKLFRTVNKYIIVHFFKDSDNINENTKGEIIARCVLLPNETPLECFKRIYNIN